MQSQLIVITPDGHIKGLDFKGKGVPLRQFGRASIARVSEIIWSDDDQRWFIRFLQGKLAGVAVSEQHARHGCGWLGDFEEKAWGISNPPAGGAERVFTEPLLFAEYEAAVRFEVEIIQCAIRSGRGENVTNP
jgi:hypothetical protein